MHIPTRPLMLVSLALVIVSSSVVAAAQEPPPRANQAQPLFTWMTDLPTPLRPQEDDAVEVLSQSWVLLNADTLAEIDPWDSDVSRMPTLTVQLFEDVAFTAQVKYARLVKLVA